MRRIEFKRPITCPHCAGRFETYPADAVTCPQCHGVIREL